MALKTWLWNLGAAGVAVSAGACTSTVTVSGETEADTETEGNSETDPDPDPPFDTSSGTTPVTTYTDTYYDTYDTDYYDTEYNPDPECDEDADCEFGFCVEPDQPWAYCEQLPILIDCEDEARVEVAWVRQGEGAGAAAGMPDSEHVVVVDAEDEDITVPVATLSFEADAPLRALPVALVEGESVVGASAADLDGDGTDDIVLSVSGTEGLRAVPMLGALDGTFAEGAPVAFGEAGDAVLLRHRSDGSIELLARLESGQLLTAESLGDGAFAEPGPSALATEPVLDLSAGPLDATEGDDLVLALESRQPGQSYLQAAIEGGTLPLSAVGPAARSVHIGARGGWVIAIDETPKGHVELQRVPMEAFAEVDRRVWPNGASPLASGTVTDVDGDGHSDYVQLLADGSVRIWYRASTASGCMQSIETGAAFDALHRPGTGSGSGLVLSGPEGIARLVPVAPDSGE